MPAGVIGGWPVVKWTRDLGGNYRSRLRAREDRNRSRSRPNRFPFSRLMKYRVSTGRASIFTGGNLNGGLRVLRSTQFRRYLTRSVSPRPVHFRRPFFHFLSRSLPLVFAFFRGFPPSFAPPGPLLRTMNRITLVPGNISLIGDRRKSVFCRGEGRPEREAGRGSFRILSNDHVLDNQPASVLVSRIHACLRVHSRRS